MRGKLRLFCFQSPVQPASPPAKRGLILAARQGEEEAVPEGQPRYFAGLVKVKQPRHRCATVHSQCPAEKAFSQAIAFPKEPCPSPCPRNAPDGATPHWVETRT